MVVRELWTGLLKWPAPVWRLRGYADAPVGHCRFKLVRSRITPVPTYFELRNGTYEPEVLRFLGSHLSAGKIFVDVGAWIGLYSLLGSDLVRPDGKVYAFEPETESRKLLQRNLKANHATNVIVGHYALSNKSGQLLMDARPMSSLARICSNEEAPRHGLVKVEATTLDEFFKAKSEQPDIVKIDVEGHEDRVVEGGERTLGNRQTTVVIELHCELLKRFGVNPDTFIHKIEAMRGQTATFLDLNRSAPGMPTHVAFESE